MPSKNSIPSAFHPIIARWFDDKIGRPTDVQKQAWPEIIAGKHVLITAPTGSGKTLAAFMWAINKLIAGEFETGYTTILYISPLKALNNDIQRNLLTPLGELKDLFKQTQELLTVKVKSIFRKAEEKKFSSMTIFLISTFILVFIYGQFDIAIAITTLVFLVFGDMFAKIFGLAYGRHKLFGKSVEGTLAYIGAVIICSYILYTSIDISLPVLIVGAVAAPFAEVLPLGMNDNFTVPILSGAVMTAVKIFFL